jgi:hypothetical protein
MARLTQNMAKAISVARTTSHTLVKISVRQTRS